jgi:ubiquitin C
MLKVKSQLSQQLSQSPLQPSQPPLNMVMHLRSSTSNIETDGAVGNRIAITIVTLTGEKISIEVDLSDKISYLKAKILDATSKSAYPGVSPDMQRLIFAGKQLEDSRVISDYGIKESSVIHMAMRLRGGMHHHSSNGMNVSTYNLHVHVGDLCAKIEVEHSDTIVELKTRLQEALHLSGACMLFFDQEHDEHDQEHELQDAYTLDDYHIDKGSVLRLVLSDLE